MKSLQMLPRRKKGTFLGRKGSMMLGMNKVLTHSHWQWPKNHMSLEQVYWVGKLFIVRSSEALAEQIDQGLAAFCSR